MKNTHITLTPFKNESRLLKQTTTLLHHHVFSEVHIIALWEPGLNEHEQTSSGAIVRRFKLKSRGLATSLPFQLIKYIEFILKCLIYFYKYKINVVNCHSLGLLPIGFLAKLFLNTKLIYDAHELETERNGLFGIRKILSKFIERRLINRVDLTIVVGDMIADHYANEYSIVRPTVVLNAPYKVSIKKSDLLRQELGIEKNKEIYLYQGMLTEGRGIELILSAFSSGEINKDKVVVFMGYGSFDTLISDYALKNENIYLANAVSPDVVLNYTASANYGVSLIEPICLSYRYCLPNKLFEYLMVGIPVIVSNLPEMRKVIEHSKSGYILEEFSVDALVQVINSSSTLDSNQIVSEKYTWDYQELVMLKSYKELIL